MRTPQQGASSQGPQSLLLAAPTMAAVDVTGPAPKPPLDRFAFLGRDRTARVSGTGFA